MKNILSIFLHNIRELGIGPILVCVLFHLAGVVLAYMAWQEWQIKQELAEVGMPTTAIVQSCDPISDEAPCILIYEYKTSLPNHQEASYVGKENIFCNKCPSPGSQVVIKYLPQDPTLARLESISTAGNSFTGLIIMGVCGFWLVFFIETAFEVGLVKKWIIEPPVRWLNYLLRRLGG